MFLSLREFKHAKLRYTLIASIMILISLLVLFVSGLAKGLSSANASSIQYMNTDYLVLQKDADKRISHSVITEDQMNKIGQYVNKKDSAPLSVQMTSILKVGTTNKIDTTIFGINADSFIAPKVVEGKMIDNNTTNEVVADNALKNNGLKIGDLIKDQISGKEFKIVGFTENQSFSHAPVIHMNDKEWSSIIQSNQNNKTYNAVAIKANSNQAQKIEKNVSGVQVISKTDALKGIPGYQEEQGSLIMMIAFLFVIGAFVLAVFFYVITIQKINQFGVLKAIGSKTSYLAKNIISQVLTLTIGSLIISVALTYGISKILPSSMPFILNTQLVLGCSGLFLLVAVLGSLLSLYKVAKIDAIEAIGRAF